MKKQAGQILLFTLVFMLIMITIVGALVSYAGIQIQAHRRSVQREVGLDIAEAGAELAIWKLNNQAGYTGESSTTYGGGVYNVVITNLSASLKLIKVDAYVPDATNPLAHRTVQLTSTLGTKNIGFNYAVQGGQGGFQLDNNAQIIGNVYANGSVSGANGAKVTGDVTSVSSVSNLLVTGNSNSDTLSTVTVNGNANAHTSIADAIVGGNASSGAFTGSAGGKCKVTGTATYNSNSGCSFLGSKVTPNNNLPAVPAPIPLPIPDQQIRDWEQEATNGGTVGSQTVNGAVSLGPKKISGNLTVNGALTLTGTIWVTGSITATNGSSIKLSASYGNLTGVLLAGTQGSSTDGYISVPNNATLGGSGSQGSYILVLSEMNNTTMSAIDMSNNAISAIMYAGTGIVSISNNAQLREVTAYKIHLSQNVSLTSDAGLTNIQYFTGSGQGWESVPQTWQLLQ